MLKHTVHIFYCKIKWRVCFTPINAKYRPFLLLAWLKYGNIKMAVFFYWHITCHTLSNVKFYAKLISDYINSKCLLLSVFCFYVFHMTKKMTIRRQLTYLKYWIPVFIQLWVIIYLNVTNLNMTKDLSKTSVFEKY